MAGVAVTERGVRIPGIACACGNDLLFSVKPGSEALTQPVKLGAQAKMNITFKRGKRDIGTCWDCATMQDKAT